MQNYTFPYNFASKNYTFPYRELIYLNRQVSLILLTPRAGVANALYRVLIEYPGQVFAMLR